jgi:filamentous hemagglutinin family protein
MKKLPVLLLPMGLMVSTTAWAEGIATDGSMGTAQTLTGTAVTIPQELGKTVGNNLFHSFSDFNINNGQAVTFTGSDSLQNVISRVTGNNPSVIDGTLKSDIKNADFYFINPHGITFNANAQVDVPAAFHVSTADKMDFGKNGGVFYADVSKDSQLSIEPPSAFGFLGNSIIDNGVVDINNAHLKLKDGKTFDVAAGEINIKGKGDVSPNIGVSQGQIRLAALKGAGLIDVNNNSGNIASLSSMDGGDINVDAGYIDTTGDGAGRIDIFGSDIQLNNDGVIQSDNDGDTNAPQLNGINIKANNLYMTGSTISSSAINPVDENSNPIFIAKGNAGNITILANNSVKLIAAPENIGSESLMSDMQSNTESDGNAGIINIATKEFELLASTLSSRFQASYISDKPILTHGHLGEVNINASENIKIHGVPKINQSSISSNTITLMTKYLDLNGGIISSELEEDIIGRLKDGTEWRGVSSLRDGKPGDIKIFASESIFMKSIIIDKQVGLHLPSFIGAGTYNNQNAGSIHIKTKEMTLIDSFIDSSTASPAQYTLNPNDGIFYETGQIVVTNGKAGLIEIDASEYLKLNSIGKKFSFSAIHTTTSTDGDGGVIRINTKNLELTDSGISSSAYSNYFNDINEILSGKEASYSIEKSNKGNAGKIFINADNVVLRGNNSLIDGFFYSKIMSSTDSEFGAAGEVNLIANKISLYDKTEISSASRGATSSGKTGDINIKTQDLIMEGGKITMENEALLSDASLQELTSTFNKVGNINLEALNIYMNHAQITSASSQNIPSGNINIDVSHALEMKNNSFINTTSNTGNGGHINFHGGDVTYLQDSGFITTVKGESGNGGNILANTKVLVMDTGIIQANAVSGNGGTIQLALEALIPSRNTLIQGGQPIVWNTSPTNINLIQAASEHGVSGTVNNSVPQLNLSGVLANMANTSMANSLISPDYCILGQGSSLSKKGRGALPMRPKDFQSF